MKRLVSLLALLAAVTTAVVLASAVPAEAAPPGCFCAGSFYTPQDWAQGDTCDAALANLRAQASAYIDCPDDLGGLGTCGQYLVLTAGCHWDVCSGKWQVDGYIRYNCWACAY